MPAALPIESEFDTCRLYCFQANTYRQDICDFNMIVSCYRPDRDHEKFGDDMRELWRGYDVRYALMDYDQSPVHTAPTLCLRQGLSSHVERGTDGLGSV